MGWITAKNPLLRFALWGDAPEGGRIQIPLTPGKPLPGDPRRGQPRLTLYDTKLRARAEFQSQIELIQHAADPDVLQALLALGAGRPVPLQALLALYGGIADAAQAVLMLAFSAKQGIDAAALALAGRDDPEAILEAIVAAVPFDGWARVPPLEGTRAGHPLPDEQGLRRTAYATPGGIYVEELGVTPQWYRVAALPPELADLMRGASFYSP